jgi:putative membrane protein
MGSADVVPGVSGGTIALITGIYEELIASLKAIDLAALKLLRYGRLRDFWKHINGNFLVAVILGVGLSIATLAKGITYLLDNEPIAVWSFFFGLILASAFTVGQRVRRWRLDRFFALLAGLAIAYYVTVASPAEPPDAYWYILLCGAIAICAMILPGISGSFILLLLGKYDAILTAIKELNLAVIAVFGLGAIAGLLSFARFLSWLFARAHDTTVALLAGFMVGSLNKVWPWKQTLAAGGAGHGKAITRSILPTSFDGDPELGLAIGLALAGIALILALEQPWRPRTASGLDRAQSSA